MRSQRELPTHDHDIAVVGAGLSGLTAAYELKKRGLDIVVLEAKSRVGGRLYNQIVPGGVIDAGGSWVGPQQTNIRNLCDELGITSWPQYTYGKHMYVKNSKIHTYAGDMPNFSPIALLDSGWAIARLNRMSRRASASCTYSDKLDQQTLQMWIDRHVHTKETEFLLNMIVATSFGCTPSHLSIAGFLAHVASAGDIQTLTGVRGAALDSHITGGAAGICELLATRLGNSLQLETPVDEIHRDTQGATIVTQTTQYRVRKVILAVDPETANAIEHTPALPIRRSTLQQNYTMGSGYKVHFVYDTPFWREQGLSGESIADSGIARITFDVTPPGAQCGVLMSFIGKAAIDDPNLLEPSARDVRKDRALQELAARFGSKALHPIDYLEQDWAHEPYQSGCVPAPKTGVLSAAREALSAPIDCIYIAGAEASPVWEGHMDGAVYAGKRAAEAAFASIKASSA